MTKRNAKSEDIRQVVSKLKIEVIESQTRRQYLRTLTKHVQDKVCPHEKSTFVLRAGISRVICDACGKELC